MRILFFMLCVALFCSVAKADIFVVHKNGKVLSLSNQNDAVIPDGYKLDVIPGDANNPGLTRPLDEYTFDGKNFKPDTKAIKDKEDAYIQKEQEKADKEAKRLEAFDKLKALGLTDKDLNVLFGKMEE